MSAEAEKLALDLEELIPAEHKAKAAIGDVVGDVLAIVAAVKAKDWKSAALAVAKLINDLAGPQPVAVPAGINWQGLIGILGKLLPLILGAL